MVAIVVCVKNHTPVEGRRHRLDEPLAAIGVKPKFPSPCRFPIWIKIVKQVNPTVHATGVMVIPIHVNIEEATPLRNV